jgi:hypothetical protein
VTVDPFIPGSSRPALPVQGEAIRQGAFDPDQARIARRVRRCAGRGREGIGLSGHRGCVAQAEPPVKEEL